jgi:3,4-dihydroxy-2-butanone 4-phosphate synthase
MLQCEVLFGRARGAEVRELVERVTDEDCPCLRGIVCPLLDLSSPGDVATTTKVKSRRGATDLAAEVAALSGAAYVAGILPLIPTPSPLV